MFGKNYFEMLDYLTANIMLPLGGLLIAIFAAWLLRAAASRDELAIAPSAYRVWQVLVRYVTPVGVVLVFLNAIGVI